MTVKSAARCRLPFRSTSAARAPRAISTRPAVNIHPPNWATPRAGTLSAGRLSAPLRAMLLKDSVLGNSAAVSSPNWL